MDRPYTLKDLRGEVAAIGEAVEAIRETGLRESALLLLIQHACPTVSVNGRDRKPTITMIRAVLDGLDGLEGWLFGEDACDEEPER